MQDFRNAYQSTAVDVYENDSEENEVELASPWQRIAAVLINSLITMLLYAPMIVAAITMGRQGEAVGNSSLIWMGISGLLLLAWGIYQAVLMSQTGQSLGKKLMGIKVVTLEGDNPGFVGTVLMREIVYNIILSVLGMIPFLGVLISLGAAIALLVMIFLDSNNRRTLQDMLAKTLVVKA